MSIDVMGASGKSNPTMGIFPQRSDMTPGQEYDLLLWDPYRASVQGLRHTGYKEYTLSVA